MIQSIRKIITNVIGEKQDDEHFSGYMLKNSLRLFMLYGFSIGIGFLSNYILVKLAGVNVYGSYIYIFNLLYMLSGFCIFGMDTLLVKKVSVYDAEGKYEQLKGVVFFAVGVVVVGSVIVSAISGTLIKFIGNAKGFDTINWFSLALPVLLMLSISLFNQSSLQGLKKIFLSQVTDKALRPLVFIVSVLILFYLNKKITLEQLVWINVTAIGIAMLSISFFLKRNIRSKIKNIKATYDFKGWSHSALAFFLINIFYVLNSRVNIFFLGLSKGNDDVGIYNIILKISEAISFVLIIVNFVLAPVFARLFSNGDLKQLQKLVTRSAQIIFLVSIPVLLAIIIFEKNILLFFGSDFLNGQQALLILCAGQFINVLFGSVGLLLMMTGNQRFSIYSLITSTVFNVCLNIVLVPRYGIVGAAIASAGSLVIWNGLMYFFVRKQIHIRPTALGII